MQPTKYDLVLSHRSARTPENAVVLGGIKGVESRLKSGDVATQQAAIYESLSLGESGANLLLGCIGWLDPCVEWIAKQELARYSQSDGGAWLKQGLNEQQALASLHYLGILLVIAGAGCGKTKTLTARIVNLIRLYQIKSQHILAITFTNKAASEMRQRISTTLGCSEKIFEQMWVKTFHSTCLRMLRQHITLLDPFRAGLVKDGSRYNQDFTVIDPKDSSAAITKIITELNYDKEKADDCLRAISRAKSRGFSPFDYRQDLEGEEKLTIQSLREKANVYDIYQELLVKSNSIDLDDAILLVVKLFKQNSYVLEAWRKRFHHILVDEYQDVNPVQQEFIELLYGDKAKRSLFVVGDPDQSIYGFRNADIKIILSFQERLGDGIDNFNQGHSKTAIKLETNYRSNANIVSCAQRLIERNHGRLKKTLIPNCPHKHPVVVNSFNDEKDEASFVVEKIKELICKGYKYSDFSILYRANKLSTAIEHKLAASMLPYRVLRGTKFYERKEIKTALALMKFVVNPNDSIALRRIVAEVGTGIGEVTIKKLEQDRGASLWETIEACSMPPLFASRKAHIRIPPLTKAQMTAILKFYEKAKTWLSFHDRNAVDCYELVKISGYEDKIKLSAKKDADESKEDNERSLERLDNLGQFKSVLVQFDSESEDKSLRAFLDRAALCSAEGEEDNSNQVSLMTIHASKGLEFKTVFLVGLSQGDFPRTITLDVGGYQKDVILDEEEERRLMYVAMTRAMDRLYLLWAHERSHWGKTFDREASCFLQEVLQVCLPTELMDLQNKRKTATQQAHH